MKIRPGNKMVSKRNHQMYHFSTTIYLYLASFYAQNIFKKLARGNAHKQNIEFEVRGRACRPSDRICTPITGKFHDKTEISRESV